MLQKIQKKNKNGHLLDQQKHKKTNKMYKIQKNKIKIENPKK